MGDIDSKAFRSLSSGLYIVSSKRGGKDVGCVINTCVQVTSKPAQISVTVNKDNYTEGGIEETGRFEVVALDETATMEHIGVFGFHTSEDTDKFSQVKWAESTAGLKYPTEHAACHISAKVVDRMDVGTHVIFVGEVEEAQALSGENPMTYSFYHQVKGGKTPPKAPSYQADEDANASSDAATKDSAAKKTVWRCTICGYEVEMDELPDDFTCPICGAGKEMFEKVEG